MSTLEQDLARYWRRPRKPLLPLACLRNRRSHGTDPRRSWRVVADKSCSRRSAGHAAQSSGTHSRVGFSARTAARAQFGYNELLQTAERNARSAIGDPIAAFFALEAYRITIEIGGIPGVQPGLSFSPGIAGIVRPAPSLSIVNHAERASMTNPGFDVSIKGRPVMIDGRTAPRYTLVVLLPSPVKLNGARATDVRASDPAVICQVSGEGTEIVLRGSVLESIAVTASSMTIRLRAQ